MSRKNSSFTLMEVIIVVIIIAILVAMGVPLYMKAAERTKTKDAVAQLKLIKEAEEMRLLEMNQYLICGVSSGTASNNNADCNSKLFLDLPTTNPDWNYWVESTDATATFTGYAQRTGGPWPTCQFSVTDSADPAISSAVDTCP